MPRTVAQWTGIVVTTIVVLGRDIDVVTALPFGIAAGALATGFVTLARWQVLRRIRIASRTSWFQKPDRMKSTDGGPHAAVRALTRPDFPWSNFRH